MQCSQSLKCKEKLLSVKNPVSGKEGRDASTNGVVSPCRHTLLESALVKNLKRQITCLEMEVSALKGKVKKEGELTASVPVDKSGTDAWSLAPGQFLSFLSQTDVPFAMQPHVDPHTLSYGTGGNAERRRRYLQHGNMASLEFTVQRLLLDKEALEKRLQCEQEERKRLTKENARLRLELRESSGREGETQKRHSETLTALNKEQERRRDLEDKLRAATVLMGPASQEGNDRAREDLFDEKEYYRIQTDRLRVAQRESLVCVEELKKQLKEERTRAAEVESRLSEAMQEIQSLYQAAAEQSNVYENMDQSYVEMCTLLHMAVDDCETLEHELRQTQPSTVSPGSSVSIGETLRGLEQISTSLKKGVLGEGICGHGGSASNKEHHVGNSSEAVNKKNRSSSATVPPPPPAATVLTPPPAATVPPPPAATVPPPPAATVPPPPAATVPPPPAATVPPPPPAATVLTPPTPSIPSVSATTVSSPPAVSAPASVNSLEPQKEQVGFSYSAIDSELEGVERRIHEQEAVLLAYLSKK